MASGIQQVDVIVKKNRSFLLVLIPITLLACVFTQDLSKGCVSPYKGFSEADLVGTWVADRSDRIDTLTIKDDGTYKQTIIIATSSKNVNYESDWQTWRVEYIKNEIPYLSMDGLRMCVYIRELDCGWVGSNGGFWWDFCAKEALDFLPGGGILMVLDNALTTDSTTDIWLGLPTRYTDDSVWAYRLQQP